jgi:hypothetical protein
MTGNYPRQAAGYEKNVMRIIPKGVTPECFYRGSSSGFSNHRLKHAGMTVCGKKINLTQQAAGN